MDINIKYIPDIFPTIDFRDKRTFKDYKLMRQKDEIVNDKTEEEWELSFDKFLMERTKQSISKIKYQLTVRVYENTQLPLLSQTDFSYIELVEQGKILNIYDVVPTYEEIAGGYNAVIDFYVKEVNRLTLPVASSNIKDYIDALTLPINTIQIGIVAPLIYSGNITLWGGFAGGTYYFDLTFDQLNLPSTNNLLITKELYIHIANSALYSYTKIKIDTIASSYFRFTLKAVAGAIADGSTVSAVINYEPETVISTLLADTAFGEVIYTAFMPKFEHEAKFGELIELNSALTLKSDVNIRRRLKVPFFLKDAELYKIDLLAQASTVSLLVPDGTNSTTYTALSPANCFEEIKNNKLLGMKEYVLNLEYVNTIVNLQK